jgi:hypothetical protein
MSESPLETLANAEQKKGRDWKFWAIAGVGGVMGLCLLLFLIALGIGLLSGNSQTMADFVAVVRDMLIILIALQGLVMGVALIIVVLQAAKLLNVLQNEIDPIVDGARDTVNTARGTVQFMSKHVTDPVIKTYSTVATAREFMKEATGIKNIVEGEDDQEG